MQTILTLKSKIQFFKATKTGRPFGTETFIDVMEFSFCGQGGRGDLVKDKIWGVSLV